MLRLLKGMLPPVILLAFGASFAAGDVYNAANDWTGTNPSSGVWSYGQEASLGDPFTLYTNNTPLVPGEVSSWNAGNGVFDNPSVFHNDSNADVTYGTFTLAPNELAFHPGINGQLSVVRFTAPKAGNYDLQASFTGLDQGSKEVYLYASIDGAPSVSLFSNALDGYNTATVPTGSPLGLQQGDTVDLMVGLQPNIPYYNDTTALGANFQFSSTVPEPSRIAGLCGLASMGLIGLVWRRWRTAA